MILSMYDKLVKTQKQIKKKISLFLMIILNTTIKLVLALCYDYECF